MTQLFLNILFFLLNIGFACLINACSNSNGVDYTNNNESAARWNSGETDHSSSSAIDYLPLDDSEYPYAGIPRIVIETENHRKIIDRETEIPAKLQIWGEKTPKSEIMDLTIRGRGNTSWGMPKKSYKIDFIHKQEMLGMPKDRDWALIANYADKTLMKNYLMYHLSTQLGAYYAPKCEFVELFINKEYLGVYLLTETIKQAKNRVNIPEDNSYLVEIDVKYRETEQVFFSRIIQQDSIGKPFQIHYPKHVSAQTLKIIEDHIKSFETFLKDASVTGRNFNQWIDVNEYIKHYWIQEFSKNPDATFQTSVFFSWTVNDVINMGPVWDFDLAFGSHNYESTNLPQNWHVKNSYWNNFIFKDSIMNYSRINFWETNKNYFEGILSVIDSTNSFLQKAAQNNFKRWRILQSTELLYHRHSYPTYKHATDDLKNWIKQRIEWIESQTN